MSDQSETRIVNVVNHKIVAPYVTLKLKPDTTSLANISAWSKAWWEFAWEMLDESGGLNPDNLDEAWGFVVRHCLSGDLNPVQVAEVICEVLDWGWDSQFVQPL
jgi:hypothetical protein